jgi:hypothetical protein
MSVDHTSDANDGDAMKVLERELWDARQERDQERTVARRLRAELAATLTVFFVLIAISFATVTVLAENANDHFEEARRARLSAEFWHHVADEAELRARTNDATADFWRDEWKACAVRGMP